VLSRLLWLIAGRFGGNIYGGIINCG